MRKPRMTKLGQGAEVKAHYTIQISETVPWYIYGLSIIALTGLIRFRYNEYFRKESMQTPFC